MKFLKRILDVVAGIEEGQTEARTDRHQMREVFSPREDPEPVGVGGRVTAGAGHETTGPYRLEPENRVDDDNIVVYPDLSMGAPTDGEVHLRDHIGHLGSTT